MRRFVIPCICFLLLVALPVSGQQDTAPAPSKASPAESREEFLKAADEVLQDVSEILSLPAISPLKKSVRSRDEIRAFIIRQMKEDKNGAERYAAQRTMEKLGLLPKGFALEPFLIELLTEQIAGLYDPKGREFYIADWNSAADQKMVMAHELAHALMDQHFKIDKWEQAAKPNDDGEFARSAVLEGTAIAAMVDYMLRATGRGIREAPEINPELFIGDPMTSPMFAKAPMFLQDSLLFPYIAGLGFTQQFLRANSGWSDLHKLFEKPPVSTQQILHPELYLNSTMPMQVTLPDLKTIVPQGWKKLDENVLGEFGVREVLKRFLAKDRALNLAQAWSGDRYAIFEQSGSKAILFIARIRFRNAEDADRFFGAYSETLQLKHTNRTQLSRRPNYFSFDTSEGGVFLRCAGNECVTLEGAAQATFDKLTSAMSWGRLPVFPEKLEAAPQRKIARHPSSQFLSLSGHESIQDIFQQLFFLSGYQAARLIAKIVKSSVRLAPAENLCMSAKHPLMNVSAGN